MDKIEQKHPSSFLDFSEKDLPIAWGTYEYMKSVYFTGQVWGAKVVYISGPRCLWWEDE